MTKPRIVALTGAGISAESGIKTFRDSGGLWEDYDVLEVASPQAWENNPDLVLNFYNQRRAQLLQTQPNEGHRALAGLENVAEVQVITQNVDDLHERAGSTRVLHLHGELLKVRSTGHPELVYDWFKDLKRGDLCEMGTQLRPHIVWFGEYVPALEEAIPLVKQAQALLIVGTSMQVYPAAGLVAFADETIPVYYIDPHPYINYELKHSANLVVIGEAAGTGVHRACEAIRQHFGH